ncbi:MAG: hypothetical protein CMQ22_07145, partial [Gammaproteobacteria bacterium]|nr:hypothetical protein [Gammaproteobacteria bacterium]
HKFTTWANYRFDLADSTLVVAAYYSFTGEYNSESIDRKFDKMPARHQTDASIIWNSGDGLLTVRGYVDNLFDARNFRSLSAGGLGNNYMLTGTLLRTRSFGLDITRRFGQG